MNLQRNRRLKSFSPFNLDLGYGYLFSQNKISITHLFPAGAGPNMTPYEAIGGENGVRSLVSRFYQLMDELPEAAACRAIHPAELGESAQKLFEYLSGWLGGPPLFVEKRGPPMLRRRHLHVAIAAPEIDGWLLCFTRAWQETIGDDSEVSKIVLPQIVSLAQHMRNKDESAA
jgi:hemoglobin